jgi:hypothetical protein
MEKEKMEQIQKHVEIVVAEPDKDTQSLYNFTLKI